MTEVGIFEKLRETYKIDLKQNNNALLFPENVNLLSKWFSDLIYSTQSVKKGLALDRRVNAIKLLRKWCSENSNDSYDCFVKCLNQLEDNCDDNKTLSLTSFKNVNTDFKQELMQFYNKRNTRGNSRIERLEFIRNRDNRLLTADEFDPVVTKQVMCNDQDDLIKQLLGTDATNCVQFNNIESVPFENENFREKQVSAVYGLINLNQNCNDLKLLEAILKRIGNYKILLPAEVTLVEYLWEKTDALDASKLLLHFKFLYERIILKISTEIINNCNVNYETNEDLSRIKTIAAKNDVLRLKFINVIYQLFAYSSYDTRLLSVLKFFE